jgi:hypothetical protein
MNPARHTLPVVAVDGSPRGAGARERWRDRVAEAASGWRHEAPTGVRLDFTLEPRRWIDLDTLVEESLAGLRDAGGWGRGFSGLDAVVATKRWGEPPGLLAAPVASQRLAALPPPDAAALDLSHDEVPRRREQKRALRAALAAAWGDRPPIEQSVWADVAFGATGSLLGALEPTLDCLEPVLGRDPRGRAWQEFFPNDDRIVWLRVRRDLGEAPVRLRVGPMA